jgi:hypothetical protein
MPIYFLPSSDLILIYYFFIFFFILWPKKIFTCFPFFIFLRKMMYSIVLRLLDRLSHLLSENFPTEGLLLILSMSMMMM